MYFRTYDNTINFEIMVRIAKAFHGDSFEEQVARIPLEMRPRKAHSSRCCIYRDRAIIRYRCMAMLGYAIEDETDELTSLSQYAKGALERDSIQGSMLTFIDEACNGCVRTHYEATSACRGCLAEACVQHCPKDAVRIVDGKSRIDPDKCVQCGKCMNVCPYHAIVQIPIPCEESCPTGAISKDECGKQVIDYDRCIFCGKCMAACPFAAVLEKSQMIDVLRRIREGRKVVAIVAPAIAGQVQAPMSRLATALRQLGFADVAEVASGADTTARLEADEFVERMEHGAAFMTSSCCPAYTQLVDKHLPELAPFVSDTRTPMHYTAAMVKDHDPDMVTVFIGPCVAKRNEGKHDELVDHVLTFQEMVAMLTAAGISVDACEDGRFMFPAMREGRSFPVSGGVTAGVQAHIGTRAEVRPLSVDGLNKKTFRQLKTWAKKGCEGNFVEVMGCQGGCVAGPAIVMQPQKAARRCNEFAANSPGFADDAS
ncbi:Ferredoxin hydrogenase [Oleidesulfovibrio alaskensis G20]|jgi:[FeFe] hydrogenase (group B1/B3)|uniref:Ferredoxin hydrogenase n=1 Tax=Oleidesulfovibrio alaskensis (strain ATCC BAA-1058 / DSM 17464 / G20) TaxID=207559 RepID=Q314X0_OLEA2|nr:4Fe-4S dicluster domain-containing protein [Oleidesulfovibrio alaskensis]ABB37526.1 Ferredoxin hydrogenase [Oleidesulfovibrio alaskensis G20]MBG0773177.1 4Fe-4S dicluster domain-containing protein [Oleidesulfovibrio alaskensis]MBL3581387.1 4Fe-4S dicluster domain-containing protein [Oleidesulfovibrio alaskensis]